MAILYGHKGFSQKSYPYLFKYISILNYGVLKICKFGLHTLI